MKRILIVLSAAIFILVNVGLSQDIINETGKDGKFIVRDAEQQEALVIEDGNVGITGELSVEQMPEGNVSNPYVVWDPTDKKFKTVQRIFSTVSPLSEPLETRSWHSVGYDGVGDDGISASVQGTAAAWNRFTTDYGYIQLGPANTTAAHIYTDATHNKFVFNKPVFTTTGEFSSMSPADLFFRTGTNPRMTMKASTGFMGVGTTSPTEHLHVKGTGVQRIKIQSDDSHAALQIDGNDSDGLWMIQNPQGSPDLDFVNWSTANGNGTRMTLLSNGNVGIGASNPLAKLVVNSGANSSSTMLFQNDITGTTATDGIMIGYTGCTADVWSYENCRMRFGTNGSEVLSINTDGTISTNGNIGIGISTPSQKLVVYNSSQPKIVLQDAGTGTGVTDGLHIITGTNSWIWNYEATDLHFGTNASNDVTIENGGQVGIQTTSPGAGLDVNTDVILGVSGTRFMEIQEITGTTGTSTYTFYNDKLPSGWTGAKTRVLSLEIQNGGSTGSWYSNGYVIGDYEISCRLYNSNRDFAVWNPSGTSWQGQAWRAMIMRMP